MVSDLCAGDWPAQERVCEARRTERLWVDECSFICESLKRSPSVAGAAAALVALARFAGAAFFTVFFFRGGSTTASLVPVAVRVETMLALVE
jgi:hypothetical protein